ncbi:HEPN domain-containing protein [Neobacillus drentensis]|uniref:ApeA N-terminal domain 1-containing protein n=1 Tax=Neobacillus drentensis TaxID=220684 RepID=UPI002FFD761A
MVKVKDLYINDSFEIKGDWYIPNTEQKKVSGILSFNEKGIYLDLFGSFNRDTLVSMRNNKYDFLHGFCEDSILITLHNGFEIQHKFGIIETTRLTFNFLFIGKHFNNIDELMFHSVDIKYTYLEEWFDNRVFDFKFPRDGKLKDYTVSYNPPQDIFEVEIPSINTVIKGGYYFSTKAGHHKHTLIHQNCISIIPKGEEQCSFKWFTETENKFKGLLSFLMNRPIFQKQIIAKGDYQERYKTREKIYIFPSKGLNFIEKEINSSEVFISLSDIGSSLENVINSWFDNKIEPTIENYIRTLYNGTSDTVTVFLNYTKALESFHRETSENSQYVTNSQYSKLRSKMIKAIEDEIDTEFKDKLRGALSYAHHYEFGKRLMHCFEDIDNEIKGIIFTEHNVEILANRIKQSRNYYTHFGKKQEGVIDEGFDLYFTNILLKTVLFYWIAKELSFTDELLKGWLDEDYNLKDMLKRSLTLL